MLVMVNWLNLQQHRETKVKQFYSLKKSAISFKQPMRLNYINSSGTSLESLSGYLTIGKSNK